MKKTEHLTVYELCKLFKVDKLKLRYTPGDTYIDITVDFLDDKKLYTSKLTRLIVPNKYYVVNKNGKTLYVTLYENDLAFSSSVYGND